MLLRRVGSAIPEPHKEEKERVDKVSADEQIELLIYFELPLPLVFNVDRVVLLVDADLADYGL